MVIDMFKFMKKEKNRRDFFKDSLRVILGSGLAVLSVVLGSRKEYPRSAAPCQLSLPCNGCRQLSDCKKEEAIVYKHQQENSLDEGVNRRGR